MLNVCGTEGGGWSWRRVRRRNTGGWRRSRGAGLKPGRRITFFNYHLASLHSYFTINE